ncbi:unnamed protein product [Lota lota]
MEDSCFSGRSWVLGDWERGVPRAWKLKTEYFKQTSTVCVPISPAHQSDNRGAHVITRAPGGSALISPTTTWLPSDVREPRTSQRFTAWVVQTGVTANPTHVHAQSRNQRVGYEELWSQTWPDCIRHTEM